MSEIQRTHLSSLKDICRCCHSDGSFKSLKETYKFRGKAEVYYKMLIETFGLLISPQKIEVSYAICDSCILRLRDSTKFRNQVEDCEKKFNEYIQLVQRPGIQNEDDTGTVVEFKNEYDFKNVDNVKVNVDVDNVDHELRNKKVTGINIHNTLSNDDEEQHIDDDRELNNIEFGKVDEPKTIHNKIVNIDDELKFENNLEYVVGLLKKHSTNLKNVNTFGCAFCLKTFVSKDLLKIHIKEHMKKKFKCDDCGRSFLSRGNLKVHCKKKHNKVISFADDTTKKTDKNGAQKVKVSSYFECRFCRKRVSEFQYKRHLKSHVDETECLHCGRIFDSKDLLQEHSKEHKYEEVYTCDFCKKRFIGRRTLIRHIDLHHMGKGRKFLCHECGMFFNDITNLRAHITTVHQKLRLFECSVCHKKLAAKKTLKVHMRTHTGERPYVCDECGDGFICFTKLKIHEMKHDIMKKYGTKYVCKICHMTFYEQRLLTHHIKTEHPGSWPKAINKYKRQYLPCPECNKIFSQKFSLDRHMAKHGDNKVPCDFCNKMVADKFSLWRHMRNCHSPTIKVPKEKVACNLCKRKVFDIKKHMAVHAVRPMKCETCGKSYPDEAVLARHVMNVHQNLNKTFHCTKCDRQPYSRKENLRIHILKKHACDWKDDIV